jgi:hypothetical protein
LALVSESIIIEQQSSVEEIVLCIQLKVPVPEYFQYQDSLNALADIIIWCWFFDSSIVPLELLPKEQHY